MRSVGGYGKSATRSNCAGAGGDTIDGGRLGVSVGIVIPPYCDTTALTARARNGKRTSSPHRHRRRDGRRFALGQRFFIRVARNYLDEPLDDVFRLDASGFGV